MNAKRVAAAAGVIHAAQQTKQTAAGIAAALEAACMLQSSETAAELLSLRQQVTELLALATVLEIPRPGSALPLQLIRSYGHTDRWSIADREGRRWNRNAGWCPEFGGIEDDHRRDSSRFTLAEAVPLAYQLAAGDVTTEALHASSGAVVEVPEDVTPQVRKLRALLAGQRETLAVVADITAATTPEALAAAEPRIVAELLAEDSHDSELHHPYRLGRDLPEQGVRS
ncbi:hypothetical protein [Streptomyces lunaelactis]|uniref:hypothetical protein n=1 Tax=Streptomyces lunaelactis TaxID=1535768 RepID=UPI0015855E12|nr:hypothetical protein [Streptomyces lunaelactis]NUK22027.1 hypothetical protein [Streptomyces lunaelactis]